MSHAPFLRTLILTCCLLLSGPGFGARIDDFFGRRIRNIRPLEYGGDSQIWDIATDNRGCTYLAAGSRLCIWDGYGWESCATDSESVIRDLVWDEVNERLYGAGDNFFGYWQRERYGRLEYHSLYSNDDFSRNRIFWRLIPCGDRFYLQTHEELYLYDNGQLNPVATGRIGYTFASGGKFYIQINGTICRIDERQTVRIASAPNDRIVLLETDDTGALILLTEVSGFFRIAPGSDTPEPIYPEASRIFSELRVFTAVPRAGGYLVGTVLDGAYITDRQGNILERFSTEDGLGYSTVLSLNEDPYGNLMLGLDGGAASVCNDGSGEFYFTVSERIGPIYAAAFWNDALYLGTNKGLYRVDARNASPRMLSHTQGQIWDLIPGGNELSVIADKGLCTLAPDGTYRITEPDIWRITKIPGQKNVFCASDKMGLLILKRDASGHLTVKNRVRNYSNPDNSVLFDKYGYIWVEWLRGKVKRLVPDEETTSIKASREYAVGEDPKQKIRAFPLDGEVVFTSGCKCYTYMPHLDSIQPNGYYTELFARFGSNELNLFQQGNCFFNYNGNTVDLLIRSGEEVRLIRDIFRSAEIEQLPRMFRRLQALDDHTVVCGFSEALGKVSISADSGDNIPKVFLNGISCGYRGKELRLPLDRETVFPFSATDITFSISAIPRSSLEYRIDGEEWRAVPHNGPILVKYIESGDHTLEVGFEGRTLLHSEFTVKNHFTADWRFYLLLLVVAAMLTLLGRQIYRSRMRKLKAKYESRQKELLEKEHVQHQNEMLSLELKERDRKLSMLSLNDITVNNLLNDILEQLDAATDDTNRNRLKPVRRCIERYRRDNGTWKSFELYFNGIFDGFFDRLLARYPNLTKNDMKICAYVKLGMNTKEIASLMNIEVSSAESARYRLRKNMGLSQSDSLTEIVSKI